jgi:cobalt-zinc-cadmium efflux system outer membrane protein
MLNIKKVFFTILLFIGSGLAFGQVKVSLEQIFVEIKENNLGLMAYDSRIQSKDAKLAGAGAWMAPMVGAGTFMTPYPFQGLTGDNDRGAFMISVEQNIPNPAKIKAKKEFLKTQSLTDAYGKAEQFNQYKTRARQLYFGLLIDYRKIRYQEENKQIMETMKKLAAIRYPFNQGGLNQVFKAEGRAYESENMILMTEAGIRSKKIALNTLMNRSASMELEIDTTLRVDFVPKADLDTTYFAVNRSDILHMDHDIHAMEKNIQQMRQEAKPDFRVRLDHMSNYSAMMPRQFTIMGMLSIPIVPWSSKMYKSEIRSMNFEREAMRQQKAAMLTEILGMSRSMENDLSVMQQQLANYENKILPSLQKYLKVSIVSYQENKSDLNTVIDSWEALNMSQMNYLDQLQKFYQMIVEYEKNIER